MTGTPQGMVSEQPAGDSFCQETSATEEAEERKRCCLTSVVSESKFVSLLRSFTIKAMRMGVRPSGGKDCRPVGGSGWVFVMRCARVSGMLPGQLPGKACGSLGGTCRPGEAAGAEAQASVCRCAPPLPLQWTEGQGAWS